ncbi:MAG: hypothetical protein JO122_02425 [Acetobacteraceae bacterium]|nr:hypothetical protein [Acetobacteraceae bacterium]
MLQGRDMVRRAWIAMPRSAGLAMTGVAQNLPLVRLLPLGHFQCTSSQQHLFGFPQVVRAKHW